MIIFSSYKAYLVIIIDFCLILDLIFSQEEVIQGHFKFKLKYSNQGEKLLDIQDISPKAIFHYQNIHFTLQIQITKPITQDFIFYLQLTLINC